MTVTRMPYLFLLGANDHVLPAVGQSGGILNDDDREELAQRGIRLAPSGMEQMGIELQNLYAALVQPTGGAGGQLPHGGRVRCRAAACLCSGPPANAVSGAAYRARRD